MSKVKNTASNNNSSLYRKKTVCNIKSFELRETEKIAKLARALHK
jgi:hypothetical protein